MKRFLRDVALTSVTLVVIAIPGAIRMRNDRRDVARAAMRVYTAEANINREHAERARKRGDRVMYHMHRELSKQQIQAAAMYGRMLDR